MAYLTQGFENGSIIAMGLVLEADVEFASSGLITGWVSIESNLSQTLNDIPGIRTFPTRHTARLQLVGMPPSSGTVSAADIRFSKTVTLSSPWVIDLNSLEDDFGDPISFARVRSLKVVNHSLTDGEVLTVGYASATANQWTSLFTGQIIVQPSAGLNSGAMAFIAPNEDGWVVTGSNKLLKIDPGGDSISVSIEIVGCSV